MIRDNTEIQQYATPAEWLVILAEAVARAMRAKSKAAKASA